MMLLELLVALALLAALSTLAFAGIARVADTRARNAVQLERLALVQRIWTSLRDDLTHAVARPVRSGVAQAPAFAARHDGTGWDLELTRARSPHALVRVHYRVEATRLTRREVSVLDRLHDGGGEGVEFGGLDGVVLRFVDVDGRWHDGWPPARPGGAGGGGLPRGMEMLLSVPGRPGLRGVFPLPTAERARPSRRERPPPRRVPEHPALLGALTTSAP